MVNILPGELILQLGGGNGQAIDATGSLRLYRDSAIWLTIRKFGFEVARLQLTRDSVKAIVPIQKTYIAEDLRALTEKFGVPAEFDWLQNFFLSTPVWPVDSTMMQWSELADQINLTGKGAGFDVAYQANREATRLLEGKIGRITTKDQVIWKQSDWRTLAGFGEFPYFRQWLMTTSDGQPASIDLKFSEVSTDASKPMRFEIPDHYTRMRI
jgi:hypothetical protein